MYHFYVLTGFVISLFFCGILIMFGSRCLIEAWQIYELEDYSFQDATINGLYIYLVFGIIMGVVGGLLAWYLYDHIPFTITFAWVVS